MEIPNSVRFPIPLGKRKVKKLFALVQNAIPGLAINIKSSETSRIGKVYENGSYDENTFHYELSGTITQHVNGQEGVNHIVYNCCNEPFYRIDDSVGEDPRDEGQFFGIIFNPSAGFGQPLEAESKLIGSLIDSTKTLLEKF